MLIFHWIAEVIHNTRYWAYHTKSAERAETFFEIHRFFQFREREMAGVYFGITGEPVNLLNHDIKTFKYTHDFFQKLPERIRRTEYPKDFELQVQKTIDLCYQSHANLSKK